MQVLFRVIVHRLRSNNEFKLRVLMCPDFTTFLKHFNLLLVCLKPLCSDVNKFSVLFSKKDVQVAREENN